MVHHIGLPPHVQGGTTFSAYEAIPNEICFVVCLLVLKGLGDSNNVTCSMLCKEARSLKNFGVTRAVPCDCWLLSEVIF